MPFFKFRRNDTNAVLPAGAAAQAQSVEVLRKRAKHRLIGASVLVLLGVAGFPLLFDTQPRPIAVDIPIEIPGKNSVKPLVVPAPAVAIAPAPAAQAAPTAVRPEKVAAAASLSPKEEIYTSKPPPAFVEHAPPAIKKEAKPEPRHESRPEPKPERKPEAKAEVKAESKPETKAEVKPEVKPPAKPAVVKAEIKLAQKPPSMNEDGARAIALLNGAAPPQALKPAAVATVTKPADETKVAAAAETKGRMVVQVGAFADAAKADEARAKLERAGLKTYTQVADTKDGKRTRVRVGPFASKAEAEKAIGKIRSLDLPVAILSF
ncbi:MAG: Sporulation domain protein [Polaromonas sp.]|nr:Sporulation domain protein [Polaromonas sp.]